MGYPQPILVEKLSKFGECGEVIHRKSPFLPVLSSKIRVFYPLFLPFVKSYPHFEKSNGGQPVFVHIFPHFGKSYPFFIHA